MRVTPTALALVVLLGIAGCSGGADAGPAASPAPAESLRAPDTVAGTGADCLTASTPPLEDGATAPVTVEVDSLGAPRPFDVHGGIYRIPPGPPLVPGTYPMTVGRDRDRLAVTVPPEAGGPTVPVTLIGPIVCG